MYGPPFPTGEPHYGHVINIVLKDLILTYSRMMGMETSGHQVRFDVHGLPTEVAVQKQLQKQHATITNDISTSKLESRKQSCLTEVESIKQLCLTEVESRKQSSLTEDESRKQSCLTEDESRKQSCLTEDESRKQSSLTEDESRKQSSLTEDESRKQSSLCEAESQVSLSEYNQRCKDYLLKVIESWVPIVNRFTSTVKVTTPASSTMDFDYMNSLFSLFSTLHKKNLIYQGQKVQPYSALCQTPVSKSEAKENRKEITETSIYVLFKQLESGTVNATATKDNNETEGPDEHESPPRPLYFLVWTTTPFTLLSNSCLCVNSNFNYVRVHDTKRQIEFICSEHFYHERLAQELLSQEKNRGQPNYIPLITLPGSSLVGQTYEPPFHENKLIDHYQVVADNYVDHSGTGIVHNSPAHGDDDYRVCLTNGIIDRAGLKAYDPLDLYCCFQGLTELPELNGREGRACNEKIINIIEKKSRLFQREKIKHSLPCCPRTDHPLYFKAIESVYLDTTTLIPQMRAHLESVNFIGQVGRDRMLGCVDFAPDWCLNRTRNWGTPIPIWVKDGLSEEQRADLFANPDNYLVISSANDLEVQANLPTGSLCDLHTDVVKDLVIKKLECDDNGVPISYRWIGYTFDCWFESGAQFYAENGYPFKSTTLSEPADFILEGMDQTRGWFYNLLVLSTAVADRSPYRNLMMNGIVLTKTGERMSKRLENYTPVEQIISQYGVDTLLLYLVGSGATRGLSFKFNENELHEIKRRVLIPFVNTAKFYKQYYLHFCHQVENEKGPEKEGVKMFPQFTPSNQLAFDETLDVSHYWIHLQVRHLADSLMMMVKDYNLAHVSQMVFDFVDKLSRKYLAHSRDHFKMKLGNRKAYQALQSLYLVLVQSCVLLGLILPETTREIQTLIGVSGSGDTSLPELNTIEFLVPSPATCQIERLVNKMYDVMTTVSTYRAQKNVAGKRPLKKVLFGLQPQDLDLVEAMKPFMDWLHDEINCLELDFVNLEQHTVTTVRPKMDVIGKKYDKQAKKVKEWLEKNTERVLDILRGDRFGCNVNDHQEDNVSKTLVQVDDFTFNVTGELVDMVYQFTEIEGYQTFSDLGVTIYLDLEGGLEVETGYLVRYVFNELQKYRKRLGYQISDCVDCQISTTDSMIFQVLEDHRETLASKFYGSLTISNSDLTISNEESTVGETVTVDLTCFKGAVVMSINT